MPLLRDAWESLQRNLSLALAYAAIMGGIALLLLALPLVASQYPQGAVPEWLGFADLIAILLANTTVAILNALFFGRLGKAIDRPLWKPGSDLKILERFFLLWLGIVIAEFLVATFFQQAFAADGQQAALLLGLLSILLLGGAVPFGACVMHAGGWRSEDTGEMFSPLFRDVVHLAQILFLGVIRFALLVVLMLVDQTLQHMVLYVIFSVFDALLVLMIFAATWRLCMLHRDSPHDSSNSFMDF